MPVRLEKPLATDINASEREMLDLLQGNVLKGHGRAVTVCLLLRFDAERQADARRFLCKLADRVTSAAAQLAAARAIRAADGSRSALKAPAAMVSIALSKAGYDALGVSPDAIPTDAAFAAGMAARGASLGDLPVDQWDEPLRASPHALLMIAGDSRPERQDRSPEVDAELALLRSLLRSLQGGSGVTIVHTQWGRVWRNAAGDSMEHFGFVDGRSQPLFLQEQIEREPREHWNPAFPLAQVLVPDPGVPNPNAFGSYLVFRKLAQDVAGFDAAARDLGDRLAKLAADAGGSFEPELAAAMLMGRHRDGTPVTLQPSPGRGAVNDFDYRGDPLGLQCPFHAHTRKVNPRGDSRLEERSRVMARRGVAFGERELRDGAFIDRPHKGVGLLFMAYQARIEHQFEHVQRAWANGEDFSKRGTGADPIAGQAGAGPHVFRAGWSDMMAPSAEARFQSFVTLQGGEYFFAPSIASLRSLHRR